MEDTFKYFDDLGPTKILHVYEPAIGLKAVLVVDNVAAGPSLGGIRMALDVSTEGWSACPGKWAASPCGG